MCKVGLRDIELVIDFVWLGTDDVQYIYQAWVPVLCKNVGNVECKGYGGLWLDQFHKDPATSGFKIDYIDRFQSWVNLETI